MGIRIVEIRENLKITSSVVHEMLRYYVLVQNCIRSSERRIKNKKKNIKTSNPIAVRNIY